MSKGNFIAGQWRKGAGEAFTSLNPATGEVIWQGSAAAASDVDAAMQAAHAAFPAWSRLAAEERILVVQRYKSVLERESAALAELIARETGKPRWDAKGEVQAMIGKITISADAYRARTGESAKDGAIRLALRHRPHGVMAVFGPYNFPGHLPNGHIVPALIAGNTAVFKPSDQTPAVAEKMVECWQEAELPEGVLNLVQGAKETGVALAAHPLLNGLLFTGSAEVGAILHRQLAGRPEVMLALEMGGNNALIVDSFDDLEAAALLVIQSAFLSAGQRCTCARRLILIESPQSQALVERVIALASGLRVGAYTDTPEPFMGPLISSLEAEKLLVAQAALQKQGAVSLLEMRRLRGPLPFLSPGILDVTAVSSREDKEYFGPLLQVIRVNTREQALAEANNTRYGLSAGIMTRDREFYRRAANELHAGVINWNRPTNGASSALPFGGVGASGNHRPSAYYAADYCAYPVSSLESDAVTMPETPLPGITR